MDFKEYQSKAHGTSLNTNIVNKTVIFPLLAIIREIGGCAEKLKKFFRDKKDIKIQEKFSSEDYLEIGKAIYSFRKAVQNYDNDPSGVEMKNGKILYPLLGLAGESGEIVGKIHGIFQNRDEISEEEKIELKKEFGDILWYVAECCTQLDIDLEDVAQKNIEKLYSRKERGVIQGSGDNR
jgi:NTP pyrophosphatase (non-canonical NTP hydrolase)